MDVVFVYMCDFLYGILVLEFKGLLYEVIDNKCYFDCCCLVIGF